MHMLCDLLALERLWTAIAVQQHAGLLLKKSGGEERRHLSAVTDFNTQRRDGCAVIGRAESPSANRATEEDGT